MPEPKFKVGDKVWYKGKRTYCPPAEVSKYDGAYFIEISWFDPIGEYHTKLCTTDEVTKCGSDSQTT